MSKRNVIVHLVWLFITLGTFVTGSQLARATRGTDKGESGGVTIPPSTGKRDVVGQADARETERLRAVAGPGWRETGVAPERPGSAEE